MKMSLAKILKLMEKKYGGFEVLFIYNDGSGAILKSAQSGFYEDSSRLFEFNNIEELIEHLQEN